MIELWKRSPGPAAGSGKKLVIANRGEIARRVLAAGRRRGLKVAVISTPADVGAPVRREADAVLEVSDFLDADAVVAAAAGWGAELLHPGYGFLSENADFAAKLEAAGIGFVGPAPESMRLLGDKQAARELAVAAGVPVLPAVASDAIGARPDIGWPLVVKAAAGGGGIGIRVVRDPGALAEAVAAAAAQAEAAFGDPTVFLERWVERPRHVEIQVFGDGAGSGVHLGARECSVQRRRQKLIEWAPAAIPPQLRQRMGADALRLVEAARYRGAGTVEFLLEGEKYWFLEVNTRLQVEHPVTEAVQGVDLVDAQLELADGSWPAALPAPAAADAFRAPDAEGAAIEARVLAEAPAAGFAPSPAPVLRWQVPAGVRCDSGVEAGAPVPAGFDSLLAKVIAAGSDLDEARLRLAAALREMVVHGPATNLGLLARVLEHPDFAGGRIHTGWVEERLGELTEPVSVVDGPRAAEALLDAGSGRRADPATALFSAALPGPAVVTELPDGIAVTLGGETEVVRRAARSGGPGGAGGGTVEAPLSGKVLRIRDEAGTPVQQGEVVAVVESMKMHWEVRAPAAGVLGPPEVGTGELVAAGTVLLRLNPES